MRNQLQHMYEQADALEEELAEMAIRYTRFRGGTWLEHAEAAQRALETVASELESLVLLAGDLVKPRDSRRSEKHASSSDDGSPADVSAEFCPHPPPLATGVPYLARENGPRFH